MAGRQGLSTFEINHVLGWDPQLRKVSFMTRSENTLPKPGHLKEYPRAFVTNTAPEGQPGEHWVAFIVESRDDVEFFDSYGLPPAFYSPNLAAFYQAFPNRRRAPRDLQSIMTHVCGQWCLFWLFHRVRGDSTQDTLRRFDIGHPLENDEYVAEFVEKTMVLPHLHRPRIRHSPKTIHQNSVSRLKASVPSLEENLKPSAILQ